ncbi:unnamed protein product [Timema podura]|uniref:Prefoldin subunit 6 n=1 Tax=Timema podura TaxID=61482 RepID=A0ABN7P4F2_TIMPD|nr:unnamed protein product [Timema podura]
MDDTQLPLELDLLKSGGEVYKLIGPVLVKQDLEEAKQNVTKRMDYIRNMQAKACAENPSSLLKMDIETLETEIIPIQNSILIKKRTDDLLSGLDKKQDAHRESISKLQQQYQQAQVKASMKT